MNQHQESMRHALTAFRAEYVKPIAERALPQRWWLDACTIVEASHDAAHDEAVGEDVASEVEAKPETTWRELAFDFRVKMSRSTTFTAAQWTGR